MDVLYYSNYCKHSKKILQALGKTNLREKISFICIDNRYLDEKTNQMYIVKYNIQNNEYIIPSFKEYEIIEKYDVMQISLGNVLDIRVCDYQKHYTVSIILKKPNNTNIITSLLEKIVINHD